MIWFLCKKIYIFFMNNNLIFCVIFYIVTLICNDKAFWFPSIISQIIFTLKIQTRLNSQSIHWHDKIKNKPVFNVFNSPRPEKGHEGYKALLYSQYQKWMKWLGEETEFMQVLIIYCFHCAAGNVINSKSQESLIIIKGLLMTIDNLNLNKMIHNLMLNHISLIIF